MPTHRGIPFPLAPVTLGLQNTPAIAVNVLWPDYAPTGTSFSAHTRSLSEARARARQWAIDRIDDHLNRVERHKPTYYRCGICECWHPATWNGDCREDANRFAMDEIDAKHGPFGWDEVPMPGTGSVAP